MANTVAEIYSNFLTEEYIREQLRQGVIPTPEQIESYIEGRANETNSFSQPLLTEKDYHIEEEEGSSSKKMNKTLSLLRTDLSVLYQALVDQGEQVSKIFDSNFARLRGFEKDIKELSEDVETLLFESQYSDRYEDIFYEKFKNNAEVDMERSTTFYNPNDKTITLKPDITGILDFDIKRSDISVEVIDETAVLSSNYVQDMEPENIFSEQNKVWQHQVNTSEDFPTFGIDLIVRLGDSSKELNKVILDPADASNRTQVSCEITVSPDGLNWSRVDGEWRKRLVGVTTFSFKSVSEQYIKFRFIKSGIDAVFENKYTYNFGIKSIKFMGSSFKIKKRTKTGTFFSKPILPKTNDTINKLGIMSCHVKPEGSKILYSIAPLNQSQLNNYYGGLLDLDTLLFYNLKLNESKEIVTFDTQSLLETEQTLSNITLDDGIDYRFKTSKQCALNLDISGLVKSETIVLRRAGQNYASLTTGKESYIDNNPFGWIEEGEYYSTYVRVTQFGGATLRLGNTTMVVNGNNASGQINLPVGYHRVKVHKNNWQSIDLTSITASSINPDVLYPYNHKYLVEGLQEELYGIDLDADQGGWTYREKIDPQGVYNKQMENWAYRLKQLEEFNFNASDSALDTFCYKADNSGVERIIVNTPNKNDLLLNERFSIITKAQDSDPIKGVILKAAFSTEDEKVTPLISEYLIRIK